MDISLELTADGKMYACINSSVNKKSKISLNNLKRFEIIYLQQKRIYNILIPLKSLCMYECVPSPTMSQNVVMITRHPFRWQLPLQKSWLIRSNANSISFDWDDMQIITETGVIIARQIVLIPMLNEMVVEKHGFAPADYQFHSWILCRWMYVVGLQFF